MFTLDRSRSINGECLLSDQQNVFVMDNNEDNSSDSFTADKDKSLRIAQFDRTTTVNLRRKNVSGRFVVLFQ